MINDLISQEFKRISNIYIPESTNHNGKKDLDVYLKENYNLKLIEFIRDIKNYYQNQSQI